jgi:hypothetical protein
VYLFDLRSGKQEKIVSFGMTDVNSLWLAPDQSHFVCVDDAGIAYLHDLKAEFVIIFSLTFKQNTVANRTSRVWLD